MLYGFGEFLYRRKIFMLLYKCIKMYRTVSQFFGFYPKFIQGKKSHKNQTEKIKTKLRKIRQNPRKTLDIFALCSNKIQSQNYTFVIPLFLLIQKLYEKSAVSHAHSELKKYAIFNYLSLLIRVSVALNGEFINFPLILAGFIKILMIDTALNLKHFYQGQANLILFLHDRCSNF